MDRVDIIEGALTSYLLLKKDRVAEVKKWLATQYSTDLSESPDYFKVTLSLWVLGEYLNRTRDYGILDQLRGAVRFSVEYVCREWMKARRNWTGNSVQGIYTVNIGIGYGALKSINNIIRDESCSRALLDMRNFLFSRLLKSGMVKSQADGDGISGDLCLMSVPFGFMDAGNQILVETMNHIDSNAQFLNDTEMDALVCLQAWYYAEKGDIARAERLLNSVKPGEGRLAYVLHAIADYTIGVKKGIDNPDDEVINIVHNPAGTGNRYLYDCFERDPRHPLEDDEVILKVVTQPFSRSQKVYACYSVNGKTMGPVAMECEESADGSAFWKCSIGKFVCRDLVEYSFTAEDARGSFISEGYSFTVKKWFPVQVLSYTNKGKASSMFLGCENSSIPNMCLDMQEAGYNTFKWSFSISDYAKNGTQEVLSAQGAISGQEAASVHSPAGNLTSGHTAAYFPGSRSIGVFDAAGEKLVETCGAGNGSFLEILYDGSAISGVRVRFKKQGDEIYYGMGERYSSISYNGISIDNYVYNQYRDQGMRTYIPVPFAISNKGYGIFVQTDFYAAFRFGTESADLLEIEVDADQGIENLDMYTFIGKPAEIIGKFTNLSGRSDIPPKWAFGPWMSSNNWDSQQEVMKQVDTTLRYEIPATVIVLEQWSDEATYYIFNDAQYELKSGDDYFDYGDFSFPGWGRWPDPKKMVEEIHDKGMKILLWQVPVMKYMDGIAHMQRDEDERSMLENGFNVRRKNGEDYRIPLFEWFKKSLVPDFSNPAARDWWFDKRLYLVKGLGIDGFKTDGGECIFGEDVIFSDGASGNEMHNRYPLEYIKRYSDFVKSNTSSGGALFSRAGYTGIQSASLVWAGDERSTFSAFRSSIRAGLSSGMSGISFWGWDIGGFNGDIPSAELFIRATQMAAFCPIMQYHAETKGQFNRDRTPWNIAERTGVGQVTDIYRKYANIRMNLIPYIYNEALTSCNTGVPMMRSMFLAYPGDADCFHIDDQYLFGESLLIAPIVYESSFERKVYLPRGRWMDFFKYSVHEGGGYMECKAELDEIPVFIKENSIIPLNLNKSTEMGGRISNDLSFYECLSFLIYAEGTLTYTFLDDLGNNIFFDVVCSVGQVNIIIKTLADIELHLILPNIAQVKGIAKNDEQLSPCFRAEDTDGYSVVNNRLIVKTFCTKGQSDYKIII